MNKAAAAFGVIADEYEVLDASVDPPRVVRGWFVVQLLANVGVLTLGSCMPQA